VREKSQEQDMCVYCGKPITEFPCKGMPNGKRAHLSCYVDHLDRENNHGVPQVH
jgi:hypothetical protein